MPASQYPSQHFVEIQRYGPTLPDVPKEPVMEPYILFALLVVGPVVPLHGREATWSAEFTSLGSCNEAGTALGKKFNSPPGQRQFVFAVEFVCAKK